MGIMFEYDTTIFTMPRTKECSHHVLKTSKTIKMPTENYGKKPVSKHQEKKSISYQQNVEKFQISRGPAKDLTSMKNKANKSQLLLVKLWYHIMSNEKARFYTNFCIMFLIAMTIGYAKSWGFIEIYLTSYLRLTDPEITTSYTHSLLTIMLTSEFIGMAIFPWLKLRLSLKPIVFVAFVFFSSGFWIYTFTTNWIMLIFASISIGIAHSVRALVLNFLAVAMMPDSKGFAIGVANLGSAFGPALYAMCGQMVMNPNHRQPDVLATEGAQVVKYFDKGIAEYFPLYMGLVAMVSTCMGMFLVPLMTVQEPKKKKTVRSRKNSEKVTPEEAKTHTGSIESDDASKNRWEKAIDEVNQSQEEAPIPDTPQKKTTLENPEEVKSTGKAILKTMSFWGLYGIITFLIAIAVFFNMNVKKFGLQFLNDTDVHILSIVYTVSLILARMCCGGLIDKFGLRKTIAFMIVLMCIL